MSKIGLITENSGFYEKLTLYDNLLFFAKLYNVSTEYVDDLLKRVGLYDHRKTLAEKLSTGMKQRMLLVRAIINKPKVLFLDEPTSGLDPSTSQTIHSLIEELKQQGTTIFLTTHDMHEATILCDKIVLLNKGKIVEEGKPAELIQKYNTNKMVKVTYCSGQEKVIPFSELNHISATQDIQTIHSCEPTLEDIFIQLTGGNLMFNQLKSLLWLRKRVIKSNKTIILQILLPLGFTFLYKHIYEIQGSLNNSMKVNLLVNCLALSLSLSVGNPISTIVSEEKEKNILRTLFLSGVNSKNYILSVLFYPVLISLVMTTAIPRILELNIENNYGPYLIISLATALVMMLINLFIGLISKTQVSAQVISLPVSMISMFIPMLSGISKDFDNVTKYSYMGLFTKSISQLESFKWQDQIASSLSLLAWLLLFATLTILQSKRLRKIS